jgi:hypothetical protein
MQSIPVGATGSFSLVVMPDHLANRFKDATLPPVLATPVMIMVMENAALNAIKLYLDAAVGPDGSHRRTASRRSPCPRCRTLAAQWWTLSLFSDVSGRRQIELNGLG